jgi:hypothetical protein
MIDALAADCKERFPLARQDRQVRTGLDERERPMLASESNRSGQRSAVLDKYPDR